MVCAYKRSYETAAMRLYFNRTVAVNCAEIKRLRDLLHALEIRRHNLRSQLRAARDTLESKEKKFSSIVADNYHLPNGCIL